MSREREKKREEERERERKRKIGKEMRDWCDLEIRRSHPCEVCVSKGIRNFTHTLPLPLPPARMAFVALPPFIVCTTFLSSLLFPFVVLSLL